MKSTYGEIAVIFAAAAASLWNGFNVAQTRNVIGAFEAGAWLVIVGGLLLVAGAVYAVQQLAPVWAGRAAASKGDYGDRLHHVLIACALMMAFVVLLPYLGYLLVTAAFLIAYVLYFGRYPAWRVVLFAVIAAVVSAYGWDELGLFLPKGILPFP